MERLSVEPTLPDAMDMDVAHMRKQLLCTRTQWATEAPELISVSLAFYGVQGDPCCTVIVGLGWEIHCTSAQKLGWQV